MIEMNFMDYVKHVENFLNEETIREIAGQVQTLGKFQRTGTGQWEPVPYSGYTIITPTFTDDIENVDFYNKLQEIREALFRYIDFSQIVAAPSDAFHMTVARLISGDVLASRMVESYEEEILFVLKQVFSQIAIPGFLKYVVKGFSIFPQGIIAAIVSPATEDDYQCLQTFRDCIYKDKLLTNLGVDRKRSFYGHITLFYIEEELSGNDRRILADLIGYINKKFFNVSLQYKITRAEVRKFNNFLSFYRQDSWPVYEFA